MLRNLGADLVGMSTALEAIAAHHLGASVLGSRSSPTSPAGVSPTPLDHGEVFAAGAQAAPYLVGLIGGVLRRCDSTHDETEPIPPAFADEAQAWIAADPDPATRAELAALTRGRRRPSCSACCSKPAHLRDSGPARRARCRPGADEPACRAHDDRRSGAVGARPGRKMPPSGGSSSGRDARHGSDEFARRCRRCRDSAGMRRPGPFAAVADAYHGLCRQAPRRGGGGDDHREPQPCRRQRLQGLHRRRRPGDPA